MTGRRGFAILALLTCVSAGCTHFREDRAIAAFTSAMVAGDLQELRDLTSAEFEQKALRRSEALDDLQVLRLPEEPPAIVSVEDISETEKQVTVTEAEGDGDSKLLYKLVLDEQTGRWVVDDILTKQQGAGVTITKPITEQMDLLLTIRDFLEVWDDDDRQSVLAITTPDFQEVLQGLPAPWLARITQQVVGEKQARKSQRKHKPQVAINGESAVVRLPRTDGTLQISMEIHDGDWKVKDAAVLTRREESQIRSVKNRARILNAGTRFVEAYRTNDRTALETLSTNELYEQVLRDVKLSSAQIPDIMLAPQDYELKATVDHATILIPTVSSVVKLELARSVEDETEYRVKDLGLYDSEGKNKLLLSAFFTATKQVKQFQRALARSDRKSLGRLSSREFDAQVWSLTEGLPIQLLPTGAATSPIVKMAAPKSHGSLTHVMVQHERGPATYVLLSTDGRLVIDDVLVGSAERQRSLRKSLELATPILAFATGLESKQIADLQRISSDDFNRKVWTRAKQIPAVPSSVLAQLTKSIRTMRTQPSRAIVELGSEKSGAVVNLVSEHQHWVIDDIKIINGVRAEQHVQLKAAMRTQMIADLKAGRAAAPTQQNIASAADPVQPPANRQRFDLSRKDAPPRRRTLSNAAAPVENPAAAISQVAGTTNDPADPGVQHAMMFAPMESPAPADFEPKQTASMPTPGLVNPAADAVPMPAASITPAPPMPSTEPMKAESTVDLDALFSSVDLPPPAEPTKSPAVAKAAPQPPAPVAPVAIGVPTHDAGRVTDPALQPIRIPQQPILSP